MQHIRVSRYFITSALLAVMWPGATMAADLMMPAPVAQQQPELVLPAVSGVNGKFEISAGGINLSDPITGVVTGNGDFSAAASLSAPIGLSLGVQGDLMVQSTNTVGVTYGGALHVFTRNPSQYLVGLTGAVFRTPSATVSGVGPEVELYLGRFSIEAWGGVDNATYDSAMQASQTGGFGFIDGVYYLTDDFRIALGGSSVLGNNAFHIGTEYQFRGLGLPLSATADARIGTNGQSVFTIGLKGYFGGDDNKSLIDRQRQDDPRNRSLDLFNAAGGASFGTSNPHPCPDGESWNGEFCAYPA